MTRRGRATGKSVVAIAMLWGAIERPGLSIATNGDATTALGPAIERQARAIANKSLAIERRGTVSGAHLSVNEGLGQDVLILGAGSAGLIAALSFKRKIPQPSVRIVRSPDIGVISVGEGTTPNFPKHLFDYLGISRKQFYALAQPTWKIGIRFIWGPRERFDYTFSQQLDSHWSDLPRPNGFYCDEEWSPFQFSRRDQSPSTAKGS